MRPVGCLQITATCEDYLLHFVWLFDPVLGLVAFATDETLGVIISYVLLGLVLYPVRVIATWFRRRCWHTQRWIVLVPIFLLAVAIATVAPALYMSVTVCSFLIRFATEV